MRRLPLLLLGACLALVPLAARASTPRAWDRVASWAIQLEAPDLDALAASPFDLLVLEYSADGTDAGRLVKAQVEALQRKPDGSRRRVLAWLPVGLAARHRFYWSPEYQEGSPPWVGPPLPDWEGLYRVRYWDPDWHDLLYGGPGAWVDQVVEAGFDGVVVDPSDTWEFYEDQGWAPARTDMVDLVRALGTHARTHGGGADFGVFVHDPGALVNDPGLLRVLTGILQVGTWFGADQPGTATEAGNSEALVATGRVARLAGALVLSLDLTEDPDQVRQARARSREQGFLEYAAPPGLDRLQVLPDPQP